MTQNEQTKQVVAEIEQQIKLLEKERNKLPLQGISSNIDRYGLTCKITALWRLKDFINSLPAEQIAERLGDEIDNFRCSDEFALAKRAGEEISVVALHFVDWQKEQDKAVIERAEDHAKLAGIALGEKEAKEKFINKACEWLNKNVVEYHPRTGELKPVVNITAFKEAMENEDE